MSEINDSTKCTYNTGDVLAITIAPDDKIQQFNKVNRVQEFLDYFASKLSKLQADHFDHWFRIELSEPIGQIQSEGPRLHLHGIIVLKSKLSVYKWLLTIMPDLLQHSRLEIHHLDNQKYPGWVTYCTKQIQYLPKHFFFSNIGYPAEPNISPPCQAARSVLDAQSVERSDETKGYVQVPPSLLGGE